MFGVFGDVVVDMGADVSKFEGLILKSHFSNGSAFYLKNVSAIVLRFTISRSRSDRATIA